jgi:hypothetical protein
MMPKSSFFLLATVFALPSQAVVLIDNTFISARPPDGVLTENEAVNKYDFDVNNDGEIDWSIEAGISIFAAGGVNAVAVPSSGFIYQTLTMGGFPDVYPLDAGAIIGDSLEDPSYSWYNGFSPNFSSFQQALTFGSFYLEEGYLGFQFEADDGIHYGYAYLKSTSTTSMTISEVAWETEPGKAIRAGNIPEPSSPILLALSTFMALAQRRRI